MYFVVHTFNIERRVGTFLHFLQQERQTVMSLGWMMEGGQVFLLLNGPGHEIDFKYLDKNGYLAPPPPPRGGGGGGGGRSCGVLF